MTNLMLGSQARSDDAKSQSKKRVSLAVESTTPGEENLHVASSDLGLSSRMPASLSAKSSKIYPP